jgi:hypothetical protein
VGDGVSMVDPGGVERDVEALYDIHLSQNPPESLRQQFPSMTVAASGAQTALRRKVNGPGQLTSLLRDLSAVGLVLTDVHLVSPADLEADGGSDGPSEVHGGRPGQETSQSVTYEVRVAGAIGDRLLHSLRCTHYAVPEHTLVRLTFGSADLARFLRACTNCGLDIKDVRRVGTAPRRPQERDQVLGA